jgi:hypothetical protein
MQSGWMGHGEPANYHQASCSKPQNSDRSSSYPSQKSSYGVLYRMVLGIAVQTAIDKAEPQVFNVDFGGNQDFEKPSFQSENQKNTPDTSFLTQI